MLDLNDAEPQREGGSLIPEGTIAIAIMTLRPGGFGDDGFIAKAKSSGKQMLDAEFTITDGKYERRKVWKYFGLEGDGAAVTRSQLRGALESAYRIDPTDMSAGAVEKRKAPSYGAFNGLAVCIKIGIEKGKDAYPDKNIVRGFITPDKADYLDPGPQQMFGGAPAGVVAQAAASTNGAAKPAWAS